MSDIKNLEINEFQYREYANKYWNDITAAIWTNRGAFEFLPIIFVNREICGENDSKISGMTYVYTNTATNVAIIYPVVSILDSRTKEKIESTIRHEIIHYLLAIQYKCHNDQFALFWLLCDCFDGNAYLPMNDKSQRIYDLAKPYIIEIFEMYNANKNERVALNFSLMLTAIDNTEDASSPDFDKLRKGLSACINAAKRACF